MKKIYKKLTEEQRSRGVIFSSCLSKYKTEMQTDYIHEVFCLEKGKQTKVFFDENQEKIKRLKDDGFFNDSHFCFNIIRQ